MFLQGGLKPFARMYVISVIIMCILFNMVEMCCYLLLFSHIYHHDNKVAILIIKAEDVKLRNSKNAISLIGQLSTWLLEILYFAMLIFFSQLTFRTIEASREIASLFKLSEFTIVPLVQILCCPMLRRFIKRKTS